MGDYCNENGLILNGQKTQLLMSARKGIEININDDVVNSNTTVSLLGLEYDKNFSTAPYSYLSNKRVGYNKRVG